VLETSKNGSGVALPNAKYTQNQSICNKHVLMNVEDERGSDSENFGARTTEIGVTVAKIWRKEFQGPICNFWKVARGIFRIILNSRVPVGISVDRDLISDKCREFFAKWWGISAGDLFFNRKYRGGPGPRRLDRAARLRSTVD
jgi:hypothetical protein